MEVDVSRFLSADRSRRNKTKDADVRRNFLDIGHPPGSLKRGGERGVASTRRYDFRLGADTRGNPADTNSPSCVHFLGLITRDTSSLGNGKVTRYAAYPVNQAMTRSEGFDATWKYALDTDRWGKFNFQLNYTHVTKLDLQRFADDEVENIRDHRRYFNYRSRANWLVGWEKNDWRTNLYGYRYGSLPSWDETHRIASYFLWNLDVQKKITPKATIGFSAVNVFNKLHPRDDSFTSYPFFWRSYSPVGRQVFANYRVTF